MMTPQDRIASQKIELQDQVQTIIKQLPQVSDPTIKSRMEYQKAQLLFKIQELYSHEQARTIPLPCAKCGTLEIVGMSSFAIWLNNGSKCMSCLLNEFWERNPGL